MLLGNIIDRPEEREAVIKWLKIKKPPLRKDNTKYVYLDIIKNGIATKSVNYFLQHTGLTKTQVSKLIHVSTRTLQRNNPEKALNINSSEKLLELTRLYFLGIETFGDKDKFNKWLYRPNLSLAKQRPIELLETSLGAGMVMDELLRIEFGVFS
jgi:putative toxin-antitoxin system antitoxin component (TIGR02293 family)